jgi:hypothetical protein
MAKQQPIWHPISKLSLIAYAIDGELEAVEENTLSLKELLSRPYSLDDALVARVIRVYTEQRDDLWLDEEQLKKWKELTLTPSQQKEVNRLISQVEKLKKLLNEILSLANELKENTIETLLNKSDAEVGLEFLSGKKRPKNIK